MRYERPTLWPGDEIAILRPNGIEHAVMKGVRTARVRHSLFHARELNPAPFDHGHDGPVRRVRFCRREGVFYLSGDNWKGKA